ncbi:hypothetical protein DXD25_13915 [Prevotella sp. TF12-30]|nr:hypothetical protein DXD25_13915 [Prevotella sp. TF12-30]
MKGQKLLAQGNALGNHDASLSPCKGKNFHIQKAMPANSCKHRFYFYNLFPEILFPEILLPESLPEGKDFFYPKLSYMMLSGSTPRESR